MLNRMQEEVNKGDVSIIMSASASKSPTGVIVLGMHRSGTSLLTGLLALGCGYSTGNNLIPAKRNNPKGFFEDASIVHENKALLSSQGIADTNALQLRSYRSGSTFTLSSPGQSALEFFNSYNTTIPWILKDPRLCITLQEWVPHFETPPAILFTNRHPLEVARSMKNRSGKPLHEGLDVWMAYNQAAIRNSAGLCRVVTSNDAIMNNPTGETSRIVDQLTNKCGVSPPPRRVPSQQVVDDFVDVTLQRSKQKGALVDWCNQTNESLAMEASALGLDTELATLKLQQATKLYCDMESGKAFTSGYMFS